MVELHKNKYTSDEYVVIESHRPAITWFNPIRYTMALLAMISALSAIIIIMIMGPQHHHFVALIISLCVSLVGVIGALRVDMVTSIVYTTMMVLFMAIQCRYYHTRDPSVLCLTVPTLGWAQVNGLTSVARLALQFMQCIASSAFLYGLWINGRAAADGSAPSRCPSSSRRDSSRFVLSRL